MHSYARKSTMLGRAHALQRVNVASLDHADAPSHVNISYAYLYVNLENQTYNEDKSWG